MEVKGMVVDTDDVINQSRISGLQIMVGVFGACILFVDGFNTQVIGYIAPQIAREWNLPRDVLGWVLAADKIGLLIGYLAVAPLSGAYGHKRVAIYCIVAFGVMALLTTVASNAVELFILRLLTGIGLGGALPSGVALTGEYFPKHRRSTSITFIYCGLSFGQFSSGEPTRLFPSLGWEAPLYVGGALSLLLAAALLVLLPDSLEYLVNRGGKPEAAGRILRRINPGFTMSAETRLVAGARSDSKLSIWQLLPQLFQSKRTFGTLMIWLALGMNLIVNTSLQVWMTKIMVDIGFAQDVAIRATQMSFLAGIVGAFIIGPLMDKFGPYRVMGALFVIGALFCVLVGGSMSWSVAAIILASSFGSGFCTSGVQKAGNALSVYFYPVALRSTGLGWGLGIGRIGAIVGPIAFGYLLEDLDWSPTAVFAATALPMLVGAVAIVAMGRTYGHARLEEPVTVKAEAAPLKA